MKRLEAGREAEAVEKAQVNVEAKCRRERLTGGEAMREVRLIASELDLNLDLNLSRRLRLRLSGEAPQRGQG